MNQSDRRDTEKLPGCREIVMSALELTCFQAFRQVTLKKFVADIVLCSAKNPAEV